MDYQKIVQSATKEFQQKLEASLENLQGDQLTPELAAAFTKGMQATIASAAQVGYRQFLESYDLQEETMMAQGGKLRYKQDSKKKS